MLARDILAIPTSTAAVERAFSQISDFANNRRRNRLSKERINQFICLRSWEIITLVNEDMEEEEESDFKDY